jgi:Kef-type K+ transport system membrane component KefB/mannitol/fructose-specific phosphotransferase system IIA component (Ntr-type)
MGGANPLLVLAVLLASGVLSGALARRLRLPAVTGQILAGILLGPSLHVFGGDVVHGLGSITHFALGLMAVAVGSHLVWPRLRNAARRLRWLLLFEVTCTPLLVLGAVSLHPQSTWPLAVLLATLSVSTAPATILALVKEARAKGVFVKTLVAAVALNNLAAICLYELAHTAARVALDPSTGHTALDVVAAPFRQLLLSGALGLGVAAALILLTRHTVRPDRLASASFVAILLAAGLADQIGASALLACLVLGVSLANLTPEKEEIGHRVFENFESAIFAIFFVMAGMELDFRYVLPGGALALAVFGARFAGKLLAAGLAMRVAGATARLRRYLGLALIPQAGLAVGLMLLVTEDPSFAAIRDLFLAVVLTVVLLNEIVGPVVARAALALSGDLGKDRPRLIDFLHEENIVTGLKAATKEEAIDALLDLLIRSHHLKIDRARLRASIFEREQEYSTCLGNGLMIPHGVLDEGAGILGAMGISPDGLDFETPDGAPVHCVVLLATPPAARGRHLEVLAALARSLGSDRSLQQQLFHARSPAHAHELLHAEDESEDFNHFLED